MIPDREPDVFGAISNPVRHPMLELLVEADKTMNQATKRSMLRWIHIVFTIPILGYVYGPASEVEQYAGTARFVFVPVLILSGYWMYSGVVFAIIGVALWLGANYLSGFGAAVLSQAALFIGRKTLVGDSCAAFKKQGDSATHKLDGRSNGAGDPISASPVGLRPSAEEETLIDLSLNPDGTSAQEQHCVRRAFLLGEGLLNRKLWVEDRNVPHHVVNLIGCEAP